MKSLLALLLIGTSSFGSFSQEKQSAVNDFDFYIGKWKVQNEREMDDGTWKKFPAIVEVRKTLNGYGNVDFFESVIDGEPFKGMTVRQFDEEKNEWQIRWYDSDDPIEQPDPSIGRFENGTGTFLKKFKTQSGHEVIVRFYWYDIKEDSFKWESGWSIDGVNWTPTWKMEFERIK